MWSGLLSIDFGNLHQLYKSITLRKGDHQVLCNKLALDFSKGAALGVGSTLVQFILQDIVKQNRFTSTLAGLVLSNYQSAVRVAFFGLSAFMIYLDWKKLPKSERKWVDLREKLVSEGVKFGAGILFTEVGNQIGSEIGSIFGSGKLGSVLG